MKYLILLLSTLLFADNNITLKPITVKEFEYHSPKKIETITILEKEEKKIVLQETAPGMKQPVIHGLMGDKVLLTLNGIKFTNALFRSGPNQYYSWVPDEFISDAQLNTTFGLSSGAIGGSIDRTLGINESSYGTEYSQNNSGRKGFIKYNSDIIEFGVVAEKTSNVETPNGEISNSSYNQNAVYFKHKNQEYGDSEFLFSKSTDIPRTDKFEKGQYYMYSLQQYMLLSHTYRMKETPLVIIPSFQQFKEKIDRKSPTSSDIDSTNNIYGLQVLGYYEPSYVDGFITYGFNNSFEDIEYVKGNNAVDYTYNTFALWSTYNGEITDDLSYKLKYEYSIMYADGGGMNRTMDNHALGLETEYKLAPRSYIFTNADMNYKFPTITNLAAAKEDSVTEIANPDLAQEKAYTLETGYRYDQFEVSVFYKRLYDMIIRTQTNILDDFGENKWKYNNADSGTIKGVSLSYNDDIFKGVNLNFTGEYLDGKTDYDYISKLLPLHLDTRLTFDTDIIKCDTIYAEWLYAPSVPEDEMALKDKKDVRIKGHNYGYNIINLGYMVNYKKQNFTVILENLFNKTSRVYGSSVDFGERGLKVRYTRNF